MRDRQLTVNTLKRKERKLVNTLDFMVSVSQCENTNKSIQELSSKVYLILKFSDNWAKQILYKVMKDGKKMVDCMGNTASMPVDPAILSEVKLDFQCKIKHIYEEHNIPDDLILNFDQTPLAYMWF